MTSEPAKNALIQRALGAIGMLLIDIDTSAKTGAIAQPAFADAMSLDEPTGESLLDESAGRAPSEQVAMASCPASASALLQVTHLLLNRPATSQ